VFGMACSTGWHTRLPDVPALPPRTYRCVAYAYSPRAALPATFATFLPVFARDNCYPGLPLLPTQFFACCLPRYALPALLLYAAALRCYAAVHYSTRTFRRHTPPHTPTFPHARGTSPPPPPPPPQWALLARLPTGFRHALPAFHARPHHTTIPLPT